MNVRSHDEQEGSREFAKILVRSKDKVYRMRPNTPIFSVFPFFSPHHLLLVQLHNVFLKSYRHRPRHHLLVRHISFITELVFVHLCPISCVGVWQNDRVEIIANDQGNRTTPSYVSFSDNERLIGDAAKNQVAMNPHNTYVSLFYTPVLS